MTDMDFKGGLRLNPRFTFTGESLAELGGDHEDAAFPAGPYGARRLFLVRRREDSIEIAIMVDGNDHEWRSRQQWPAAESAACPLEELVESAISNTDTAATAPGSELLAKIAAFRKQ